MQPIKVRGAVEWIPAPKTLVPETTLFIILHAFNVRGVSDVIPQMALLLMMQSEIEGVLLTI